MQGCVHKNTCCINEYELIRKYECVDCGAIMMCSCDESIGVRFLSHQLSSGTCLETQAPVQVTHGFFPSICRECRGFLPEAHPVASVRGRTSKIKRYYWRELALREMELYAEYGGNPDRYIYEIDNPDEDSLIGRARTQALKDVKRLHAESEKYSYLERSTAEIIEEYKVDVINEFATYIQDGERKSKVKHKGRLITVEEYATSMYQEQGYKVLVLESSPFHVIFAVYMWLVIQDPTDDHVRMAGFGERGVYEENREKHPIWVPLPDDFGSRGYAKRRSGKIESHFISEMKDTDNLLWLFDYWIPYSEGLRQYLWAHRQEDIEKAHAVVEFLPPHAIIIILKYLVGDYWGRYLGWPDLLIIKDEKFIFVEVKSSKDKLSEEQKKWIVGNYEYLNLPFKILKIHRKIEQ